MAVHIPIELSRLLIFLGCGANTFIRVSKSRRLKWAGYVARMGERMGVYWVLVGKPEGRKPLGRPTRPWADNIKMNLRGVG
jgi:hypothetical protein